MWKRKGRASERAAVMILAISFSGGAFLGQVFANQMPESTGQELCKYVSLYSTIHSGLSIHLFLSAIMLYLRAPVLAVLLGFSSFGAALLFVVTAANGFLLSFSIGCFAAAFGGKGVLIAAAVLGVRCLVTLPCYFFLAGPALENTLLTLRREREPRGGWWKLLGVCALVLTLGACAEVLISPRLLELALSFVQGGM